MRWGGWLSHSFPFPNDQMVGDNTTSSMEEQMEKYGLHMGNDDYGEWNDDNKDHPRNWGIWAKTYNNSIIFWLEFFMTFISTAGVMRLPSIALVVY